MLAWWRRKRLEAIALGEAPPRLYALLLVAAGMLLAAPWVFSL